jgi:hypothetical protein
MAKTLGDIQSHVNPVRIKVKGNGSLRVILFDDGLENNAELFAQTMSLTSARSLNYLSNFRGEKICFTLTTSLINEYFTVDSMFAYLKPTAASFPQS